MQKIAFVSTNEGTSWSGSEELWSQTAIKMAKQGLTIGANVKGWKQESKKIQELEQFNCCVVRRWDQKNLIQKLVSKLYKREFIFEWLDKIDPDLVVISQGINYEDKGWMEACLIRNIPYVVIVHAAGEHFWPSDELVAKAAKGYQSAERCYFVSQKNLELTVKQLATELDNAKIIRNPYKVSYDVAPSWPTDKGVLRLACVARLDPESKGQDILFEVLRSKKWKSRPIEVTLFGDGYQRNTLRRLKDLWSLDNVKFGGFVDNVEAIWADHHALILPSRLEGLPLSIVEAMLCGRFCIVTDVAGNTELIEDNINGFVAMAPKTECLDEAMERAWQRRESWREIGKEAYVSVRKLIPRDPIHRFMSEIKLLLK
ncbi:MAG: glycosyltransferase family 4 protein [Pelatocladus maniniholoensis HA4357-MV3]|jgi:glycosyltransferase involved in cell wall biosynthesis|uniref:Glycosyltransferase family 4 protein n=1 Tax=Pelatocladus maniniholoensis HA4357-MV3 TaxID=1117104 RepID=A0A9E3H722_9NOST|nr:glycosyltransferase family 4 protein [Pelatocladus maniniholoensis HA4357-MV3]